MFLTPAIHQIIRLSQKTTWKQARTAIQNPRQTSLIKRQSLELFFTQNQHPLFKCKSILNSPTTSYKDYKPFIDQLRIQIKSGAAPVTATIVPTSETVQLRFEPTSGSTQERKWLPYNQTFLDEINRSANAWLYDIGQRYPGTLAGKHYWSLSWLPNELRNENLSNDDSKLFPWWKRLLFKSIFAVPSTVSLEPTSEASLTKTLSYLTQTKDLSFISVWSPTFLIAILDALYNLIQTTSLFSPDLVSVPKDQLSQVLWPKLKLISCWDTGSSAHWIPKLYALFPQAKIQGKGLWATEGVVTVPFEDNYYPAIWSHYLEFKCKETQKIFLPHELEPEQIVTPLITTGAGLIRYELEDELKVSHFNSSLPSLKFLGRANSVDMVGEKLDGASARKILDSLNVTFPSTHFVSLIACLSDQRYYALGESLTTEPPACSAVLEKALCRYHHYSVARELNQLKPAQALIVTDPVTQYQKIAGTIIFGNLKIEPLLLVKNSPVQLQENSETLR